MSAQGQKAKSRRESKSALSFADRIGLKLHVLNAGTGRDFDKEFVVAAFAASAPAVVSAAITVTWRQVRRRRAQPLD